MSPLKDETRSRIRHMYFVDHVSPSKIGEALHVSPGAVHRALVLRGGLDRRPRPAGPFRKESSP